MHRVAASRGSSGRPPPAAAAAGPGRPGRVQCSSASSQLNRPLQPGDAAASQQAASRCGECTGCASARRSSSGARRRRHTTAADPAGPCPARSRPQQQQQQPLSRPGQLLSRPSRAAPPEPARPPAARPSKRVVLDDSDTKMAAFDELVLQVRRVWQLLLLALLLHAHAAAYGSSHNTPRASSARRRCRPNR